ncbi:capsid protein [Trichinella pseudospiralis]
MEVIGSIFGRKEDNLNMVNMNSLAGAPQLIPRVRAPDSVFSQKPGEFLWKNELHTHPNNQKSIFLE